MGAVADPKPWAKSAGGKTVEATNSQTTVFRQKVHLRVPDNTHLIELRSLRIF